MSLLLLLFDGVAAGGDVVAVVVVAVLLTASAAPLGAVDAALQAVECSKWKHTRALPGKNV